MVSYHAEKDRADRLADKVSALRDEVTALKACLRHAYSVFDKPNCLIPGEIDFAKAHIEGLLGDELYIPKPDVGQ